MPYVREVYRAAMEEMSARREKAAAAAAARREEIYAKIPRIAVIDSLLSQTAIRISREILAGGADIEARMERLKNESLALKGEKAELLVGAGYPHDYLEPRYFCPKCRDEGYVGSSMCECLRSVLVAEAYRRSNLGRALSDRSLDSFRLDYYSTALDPEFKVSPRKNAERILKYCRDFVDRFPDVASGLLMIGPPGLGKTFLSAAVANALIEKGYGVIYETAHSVFQTLSDERFGQPRLREGDIARDSSDFCGVDLLIIDDLGTEYVNAVSVSVFYNLINTRAMLDKRTIISTNLSAEELERLYGERVMSRIFGDMTVLRFFGEDIRQVKQRERMKKLKAVAPE